MKKVLSPRIKFLIGLASMIVLFATTFLIIELIPEPLPEFKAVDDVVTTNEDTSVTIKVLENDLSADPTTLSIKENTQPAHGRLSLTTTGFRYTPTLNYNGEDSFTYTIQNADLETSVATVTITITSVNDVPIGNNDYYTTTIDTSDLIDVLSNDIDYDYNVITIDSFFNPPSHGTITIEDGKVRYTPDTGYTGTDNFGYTLKDSHGATDTAVVTVIVLPQTPQD